MSEINLAKKSGKFIMIEILKNQFLEQQLQSERDELAEEVLI